MSGFPRRFGPYVLLKPLARGGMGALYLAISGDKDAHKLCVIKTVLPHLADKEYLQRFRDEAKVVVRLSHGNLVPVFDSGQVEGEIYLGMDFVEGKDLRAIWNRCAKKGVAFPLDVGVHIVKELARGLHYAHTFPDLQLVHRDVSPPNVLLSYAGEVKLTDFGLASSTLKLEKTAPGIIYGKVSYMSPEQARGEKPDGRTDLYATGIILWELLTGRQLFPSTPPGQKPAAGAGAKSTPTSEELLSRVRNPVLVPPSKRASRVTPELDRIALRALAPKSEERYQTCDELRQELATYLAYHHPGTDADRVSSFLTELYGDDIAAERAERQRLLEQAVSLLASPGKDKGDKRPSPAPERERPEPLSPHALAAKLGPPKRPLGAAPPPPPMTPGPGPVGAPAAAAPAAPVPRRLSTPTTGRQGLVPARPTSADEPAERRDGAADRREAPSTLLTPPPSSERSTAEDVLSVSDVFGSEAGSLLHSVVGKVVEGRYVIRRLSGEGGMGRVYEAEHIDIGKRVALKILHPAYTQTPDLVERLRREARAASKINHPNVVDVTDSGTTEDGSFFFVMEYLEGIELGELIYREKNLPVQRALTIAAQMCRALQAAHQVGVIHRDLKPENVLLVTRDGYKDFVKVLDFGIAKSAPDAEQTESSRRARSLTHPGMTMGTPEYMAPEQAAGRPADARSDIYALGSVIYEMLTGEAPYEGTNFMEILHKKANEAPRPLTAFRSDVPAEVEALVMRTLAKKPAERPQSMEELEQELIRLLGPYAGQLTTLSGLPMPKITPYAVPAGLPPVAGSGPPLSWRLVGRKRTAAAVGAGCLMLSLVAFAVTHRHGSSSVAAPPPELATGQALPGATLPPGALGVATTGLPPVGSPGVTPGAAGAPALTATAPLVKPSEPAREEPEAEVAEEDATDKADEGDKGEDVPVRGGSAASRAAARVARAKALVESRKMLDEGERLLRAQHFNEARDVFTKLTKMKPVRGSALVGLAEISFQEKKYDEAVRSAKLAAKGGGGVRARVLLGDAHFRLSQYKEAVDAYEQALKLEPSNSSAKSGLALASKRM